MGEIMRMNRFLAGATTFVVLLSLPVGGGVSVAASQWKNCGGDYVNGPTVLSAKGLSCERAWKEMRAISKVWMDEGVRWKTLGWRCSTRSDQYGHFEAQCRKAGKAMEWLVAA